MVFWFLGGEEFRPPPRLASSAMSPLEAIPRHASPAEPASVSPLGSLAGSRMWQAFGWSGVCALGLVATVGATPPLVTALAHGAGSQTAPVKKQK